MQKIEVVINMGSENDGRIFNTRDVYAIFKIETSQNRQNLNPMTCLIGDAVFLRYPVIFEQVGTHMQ